MEDKLQLLIDYLSNNKYDELVNSGITDININYYDIDTIKFQYYNNFNIMKYLIDNNINIKYNNNSFIIFICIHSTLDIIKYAFEKYLLDNKEIDTPNNNNNNRPIHYLTCLKKPEYVKYGIQFYLNNNLDIECISKESCFNTDIIPLFNIIKYSTDENINYIIDIYEQSQYINKQIITIKDVNISKKLNIRIKDNYDNELIHIICSLSKSIELIKRVINLYITFGYNIDCSNTSGWTPLHFICSNKNSNEELFNFVIDLYINNGYNINKQNNIGRTYLDYAIINKYSNNTILKIINNLATKNKLYEILKI
jgi:hypothetical protein